MRSAKKSFRSVCLTAAAAVLPIGGVAHADVIARFNFPGTPNEANKLNPTITADNVDVTPVAFNSTVEGSPDSAFEIRVNGFATDSSLGDNFFFSVTPLVDPGTSVQQQLNIESFSIDTFQFGGSQPSIEFTLSITTDPTLNPLNFTEVAAVTAPGNLGGGTLTNISGPVTGFDGITSELFFVISGSDVSSASAQYRLDNLIVEGTVTPVPEPGSLALAGLGLLAAFSRRMHKSARA